MGTGGLVKAYSNSTKQLLEIAHLEKIIEKCALQFSVSYSEYNTLKTALAEFSPEALQINFGTLVSIECAIPQKNFAAVSTFLQNLTNGRVVLQSQKLTTEL